MSLLTIGAMIIAALAALIGGITGKAIGKSSGRREGVQQAQQEQQVVQAKAINESVQERNDVEVKVAATTRGDLDNELQEFSRPD